MTTTAHSRWRRIAPFLTAVIVAGACSSDFATGPTTSQNIRLMAHFDSVSKTSASPVHGAELLNVIVSLAEGAPVGSATLRLNGVSETYSFVARYEVLDADGAPADSDLIVLAWRGANADSLILLVYHQNDLFVQLSTPADSALLDTVGVTTGEAIASAPHGGCTPFVSAIPFGVFVPVPTSCRQEAVTTSATAALSDGSESTVSFVLPAQRIAAIRYEYNPLQQ